MTLSEAIDVVVQALRAAGARATSDPRNLNPPIILVLPPAITWRLSCADLAFDLYAIAGDAGTPAAVAALEQLIGAARAALGGACTAAGPVDISTADAGVLPAYRLQYTARKIPLTL